MFLIALVELAFSLISSSQDLALLRLEFLGDFSFNIYILNGLIRLPLGLFQHILQLVEADIKWKTGIVSFVARLVHTLRYLVHVDLH